MRRTRSLALCQELIGHSHALLNAVDYANHVNRPWRSIQRPQVTTGCTRDIIHSCDEFPTLGELLTERATAKVCDTRNMIRRILNAQAACPEAIREG